MALRLTCCKMYAKCLQAPSAPLQLRSRYHDYVRSSAPGGSIRIPLVASKVIGASNSRGNRSHQEDFYSFSALSLYPEELRLSVKKSHNIEWDPTSVDELSARQVLFVGIYDGHGGSAVSQYLRQELHGLFESVHKEQVPEVCAWAHEIGGYFKRFKGGVLAPWAHDLEDSPLLDLEARATLAFFEVDKNLSIDDAALTCGATASVAILHALDTPAAAFFAAKKVALTVAHCGDTRAFLCSTRGGKVFPMTENHHADARLESNRLRRMMGSALITDSFGETRWMGALANTRSLGDLQYKKFGVTPEPEVRTLLLNSEEWAYLILVSDGISSVVSDQEAADVARAANDPQAASERILAFAEDMGGEDNMTAIIVPLAGWGKIKGPDMTQSLREYRRRQAIGSERQRRM